MQQTVDVVDGQIAFDAHVRPQVVHDGRVRARHERFLAEFVEVGGVATVIEILSLPQLPEDDKRCAIRLLMSIASAGRHYKEIVCEGDGIEALVRLLRAPQAPTR